MLCLLSVRTIRAFESRCACVESKELKANNKNNHNCPSPCRIFKSNQKWQHLVHGGTWLLWSLLVSDSYSNTKVQNTKTASLLGLEMSRVIDLLSKRSAQLLILRMHFWWSLCTLHLLARQVIVPRESGLDLCRMLLLRTVRVERLSIAINSLCWFHEKGFKHLGEQLQKVFDIF